MSLDESTKNMESGASYPRTESTIVTPDKLEDEYFDNLLHDADLVGEEYDDLYRTPRETRKEEIKQLLEKVNFIEDEEFMEEKIRRDGTKIAQTATDLSIDTQEKIKSLENLKISRERQFSREEYEEIQREISEAEEEIFESI